ncbi:winged helix-turn-helix transcriptional regulator [Corynebacterium sp.]|uniref:winged helix-turn-helix transcriptional regulator n=1 Tax=Corynebacterium sp. TaxID=1720 RepID=UPI003461CCFF
MIQALIDSNVPPRVKYELTDKGQNPAPIIAAIQQWDVEWLQSYSKLSSPLI